MTTIERLSVKMVEAALEQIGYKYSVDGQTVDIRFKHDEDWGCDLSCLILVSNDSEMLFLRSWGGRSFKRKDWAKLVFLCNQYNNEHFMANVLLNIEDDKDEADLETKHHLDTTSGVHVDLVRENIALWLQVTFSFWKWLHIEKGV